MNVDILYRGPLASCNYGCEYCPFAKRVDDNAALAADRAALDRFTAWLRGRSGDKIGVLFTPWGEALTRRWYQQAFVELSQLPQIRRVAAQTNLSTPLDWLDGAHAEKIALWCTYHPEWTTRARFLAQVAALGERGVACSVGVVGFRRSFDEIEALRRELPSGVYLWVNAPKSEQSPYSDAEMARLLAVDPRVADNCVEHASRGESCRAGADVVSVDGDGVIRRCHFVKEPIGNLYDGGLEAALGERACPNDTCGCHIGYVHLDRLGLRKIYGDRRLERIYERN
jgi:hypothetical protein